MAQTFYIRDFFIHNDRISAGYYMEHRKNTLHSHEFWEISYVTEGRGEHLIENQKSTAITEGDFLFISPGPAHCIMSPPPEKGSWVRVCNVLITPEYMQELISKLNTVVNFTQNPLLLLLNQNNALCEQLTDASGNILKIMMTLTHEYKNPTLGSQEIIENELQNLLIYICRAYEQHQNGTCIPSQKEIISELTNFIYSNYGRDLSLDFLADYVHLSPEYLSRYFKKNTGKNISTFITETRIQKAKYLLKTTDHPIHQIAKYCGYATPGSFEKAFKKITGMTGGEYRKENTFR